MQIHTGYHKPGDRRGLLEVWEADLRTITNGHYAAAVLIGRRNYQLGGPVILLSAITSSAIFASLAESPSRWATVLVGLVSLLAGVLSALQTFLRFSERAEKHRNTAAQFAALLKELEEEKAFLNENPDQARAWCTHFRERWDKLSRNSPTVPERLWEKHRIAEKQSLEARQREGR